MNQKNTKSQKNKILLFSFLLLMMSCSEDPSDDVCPLAETENYLHISHTRTDVNPYVKHQVRDIDFERFDMLWLGGDLTKCSSCDEETLMHIDSIYDIGNTHTLWSLGNHDDTDVDLVQNFTNRPRYYTFHKNGITFLVLDTQINSAHIIGEQKALFDSVTDTLVRSSHLIILHHKLIWMPDNPELEQLIPSVSNGELGDCLYCLNPNNFYDDIYPSLVDVNSRGIKVLCIGGDIGTITGEFEYTTPDNIQFLASGIKENGSENKALLFHHDLAQRSISWNYKLISEL